MNFRNISAWSIRNPVPSIVLFCMLTVAGLMSFHNMQINNDPDIDFPVVIVSVSQPGAAPSELETQVTQKVESAVRSLQGIDEIDSTVTEGQSTTVVQLAIGTPIDRAVEDVRSAVQQVRSDLPDGILEPQVERVDFADEPIGYFSAESTAMTVEQLSWFIDDALNRRLMGIEGVSVVSRTGGVSREVRVELDPVRMQAQGVTASQINQQLRAMNLNAAGG
ncbi:MAG TPA: efflux RND transporter permease subunit, partial [Sphingomonas sp.]|nr:efflux RND transporter permease subunit [Sphingomonas sp.]